MSEYDDKLNQEAAPQPQALQTPPDPDPVPRPRKVRRVGTFTFGLVLVAAGVLLILRSVMPQLDLSFVASLAPVVLIALGIEVLIYAARPDVKLKYDGVSMFVCFLMLVLVGSAAALNELWNDYGPAANMAENRMERYYEQQVSDLLATREDLRQKISNLSVWVDLSHPYSEAVNAGFQNGDTLHVNLTVRDNACQSAGEFAAMARQVMDLCGQGAVPVTGYSFTSQENNPPDESVTYSLEVEGAWQMQATAETLAQDVYESYWYQGERYSSYDSMRDYRSTMIRENLAEEYYGTFGEYPGEEWLDEQMAAATAETAAEYTTEAPAAPQAPNAPEYSVVSPAE